jgi:AAA family ATP:ADP antiporter
MLTWLSKVLLIRDDERPLAFYFLLIFLVIGWGTAIGRGTADALFMKRFGVEYLPAFYAVLSPVLALTSLAYAATVDRLSAERLFQRLLLVLGVVLLLCWLLIQFGTSELIYPFYFLVYEVASEVLLIHGALYLSQNLEAQQAKRLTPPILAGAQLGTILGGLTLVQLSETLGVQNLILAWFGSLLLAGAMILSWHRLKGPSVFYRQGLRQRSGWRTAGSEALQGIKLLRRSNLLRVSSAALFFMVIAFYILHYMVHTVYTREFASEEALSSFYGGLVAATSAAALLLQLTVTGRAIRRFGVRTVNLLFPGSLVIVFCGLSLSFTLPLALLASFSKDTIMPAFRNPVRNLFFNALPANVQGRARATSLVVVMPLALLLAGGFLWFVQHFDEPALVAAAGLGAALFYLLYNLRMNKVYLAEIIATLKGRLYVPEEQGAHLKLGERDDAVFQEMLSGLAHADEQVSVAFAEALVRLSPKSSISVVLPHLAVMPVSAQDRLVNLIAPHDALALQDFLWQQRGHPDLHLRATALTWLVRGGEPRVLPLLEPMLEDASPRLRACAVRGLVESASQAKYASAAHTWLDLLESTRVEDNIAALELVDLGTEWVPPTTPLRPALSRTVRRLVAGDHRRARVRAHQALRHRIEEDPEHLLDWLGGALRSHDQELRLNAVQCIAELNNPWSHELLYRALNDPHPDIRQEAVKALFDDDFEGALRYLEDNPALAPHRRSTLLQHIIGLNPQYEGLRRLAGHWTDKAVQIATLKAQLSQSLSGAPEGKLVLTILGERSADYLDLALEAISPVEGHEEVAVIRAALASGERMHIASAREVLQNLRDRELAQRLDGLLGDEPPAAAADPVRSLQQLNELAAQSDDWFRSCVQRIDDSMVTT